MRRLKLKVRYVVWLNNIFQTPLNRGTAAIPLLFLSHEKVTSRFTPFKWRFCYFPSHSTCCNNGWTTRKKLDKKEWEKANFYLKKSNLIKRLKINKLQLRIKIKLLISSWLILFFPPSHRSQYTTISKKDERVHKKRERRAESVAHIDESIKKELLERLQKVNIY